MMERSLAIKCPSIHYHLAGTKKVQQELAKPGRLDKYLTKAEATVVQESFTGLFSLDQVATEYSVNFLLHKIKTNRDLRSRLTEYF